MNAGVYFVLIKIQLLLSRFMKNLVQDLM